MPAALVLNRINPIMVQGAALAGFTMISGFDRDITEAVPDGAMVEIDAESEPPVLRVLSGGNDCMSYEQPYAGVKVIDLSQGVAGPYCAMLLAQYGAEVIKVEPLEGGDWSRGLGVKYGDQTAYSIPCNLGKRSIALDLKSAAGRDVLWRLIAGADVFVQGFRPGVIERLGFGYAAVTEREPRILYVSVSGFGQTGPLAERPAMDPVLQAFTGSGRREHRRRRRAAPRPDHCHRYEHRAVCVLGGCRGAARTARRGARPTDRGQPAAVRGRPAGGAHDAAIS